MGLALFLRLVHLGHLSFWSDEILSITRSQAGWSFQLHMLTYESILRLWMGLGESEAVVRMLSVLFGVAAVPAMYALGARLFGVRAGIIASLLLGHPQVIAWHCRASWSENGLPPDEQGRRDGATADGQSTRAVRMLSIWPGRRPVVRA